jgi:diguanylate cyclase (GGDEF)-like protein
MGLTAIQSNRDAAVPSRLPWKWALRLAASVAGVAAVAWVWRLGMARFGSQGAWLLVQLPLGICTASLAWRFAARHERQWIRPARHLVELIEQVRAGEAPIQSLSEVQGPITPLAQCVQNILRDLRREEQTHSRLQAEVTQLVRRRTDALESKVQTWRTRAFRDALTGLCNRRDLDEQLPKVLEQCRIDRSSLCVLSVDLDHFKRVNDTLGHAAGDNLLRDVGKLIRSTVRETDLAFRVGGDEFVILLPDQDAVAGRQLAARLVSLVDQLAKTLRTDPRPGLSIGVCCLEDVRDITPADALRRGDEAMYETKVARKAKR